MTETPNDEGSIQQSCSTNPEERTSAPKDFISPSESFNQRQLELAKIRREIEKDFIAEKEREFRKVVSNKIKKEWLRGVEIDAQEAGRLEFVRQEKNLRAKMEAELRPQIEREVREMMEFERELEAKIVKIEGLLGREENPKL